MGQNFTTRIGVADRLGAPTYQMLKWTNSMMICGHITGIVSLTHEDDFERGGGKGG